MAIPSQQLRHRLNVDEPNYADLVRLGPQILPQLMQLVQDRDEYVAANAASLAGMIRSDRSIAVLERAARSASAGVRAAAAGTLRHVQHPSASKIVAALLNDKDVAVRKFAIKAAAARPHSTLATRVGEMSETDPEADIRALAAALLKQTRGK